MINSGRVRDSRRRKPVPDVDRHRVPLFQRCALSGCELTASRCRLLACSGGLNRPDKAEVSGSSPLRPTHLTRGFAQYTTPSQRTGSQTGSLGTFGLSTKELVHHRCSGLNYRLQLVAVDEFGHSRAAATNEPRDLLHWHPGVRQHRPKECLSSRGVHSDGSIPGGPAPGGSLAGHSQRPSLFRRRSSRAGFAGQRRVSSLRCGPRRRARF